MGTFIFVHTNGLKKNTFYLTHHIWRLSNPNVFFLIHLLEGGVQLGPLGTAAADWPIVPAPGDYDDGEFGAGKPNYSEKTLPSATLSITIPT
jgi:hypothetical protein